MTATIADVAHEAPTTLLEPPPRALGSIDQIALWGNLAVTLTIPVAAAFVVAPGVTPELSLAAALSAVVVGSIIGSALLGLAAVPGARTGAPAMLLLRGLLGRRASYVPTALNVAQLIGWATVEVVIIGETAARLTDERLRAPFVIAGGVVATLMALRPLGVVRLLRRVAAIAAIAATAYLLVQVVRLPLPPFDDGSWSGFWKGTDVVIALAISWAPLAADYSRHSRSDAAAFAGAFVGFGVGSIAYFALGVFALAAGVGGGDVIGGLIAIPVGGIALAILVLDEIDEAFANVYSTAVSVQNVRPALDRRVLAVAVGVVAIALGLTVDIIAYEIFLLLIGSVFVPLFGAFLVDYFVVRRGDWDVSDDAPTRSWLLVPWLAGFVTYQLVNPGAVSWWASFWSARAAQIGFTAPTWMSASLASLAVSAALTLAVGQLGRRRS